MRAFKRVPGMEAERGAAAGGRDKEPKVAAFLRRYQAEELLRFVAVGSVDDGKSTLIGRLLYDTGSVYRDQVEAVRRASKARAPAGRLDYALFTDGLRAEREQGITIDVAYRYFFTGRRKFIVADTPGHEQYTRNMVTGASTASVALILVDARHGVMEQSRRHAAIASLLRIPHLVVCVNKMDLCGYERSAFEAVRTAFGEFVRGLSFADVTYIPVSALCGDNVTEPSRRMPWYDGPTLLSFLEGVPVLDHRNLAHLRFPVQRVVRPHLDDRGFAGSVASGILRPGDEVLVLPSGLRTKVTAIDTFDGPLESAEPPQAVTVRLADEIDVSRGDMLADPRRPPATTVAFDAHLVWMDEEPLAPRRSYYLKHTTRLVRARIEAIHGKTDLFSLGCKATSHVSRNDIVRVRIGTQQPIFCDPYPEHRSTGAFILIDPIHNRTVAAGMVERPVESPQLPRRERPGCVVRLSGDHGPRAQVAAELADAIRAQGAFGVALASGAEAPDALAALARATEAVARAGGVAVVPPQVADLARGPTFDVRVLAEPDGPVLEVAPAGPRPVTVHEAAAKILSLHGAA